MPESSFDPLAAKAHADAIVERAAQQIQRLLKEAVVHLDPFPPFPGAFFSYGIEVEPAVAADPNRGCVVLGQDGELYEFIVRLTPDEEFADPVAMRDEELKKLDLHPRDYIVYGYNALVRVAEILLEREEQS